MFNGIFNGKSVWLSGHTGFKGAWLAEWLLSIGARVHGFALPPSTQPALFVQLGLASRLHHEIGDIRDPVAVKQSILTAQPDFVFHLAAQPLVRLSYEQPVETYATNVMGTIHVLQALRELRKPCPAVMVTTDKCYENREWVYGYREEDALGGHDPYSSSKAAAEIAIGAWRRSFFQNHPVKIASARAGNVIGGGDWAQDRIVPDCIRALQQKQPIPVRNKRATRPWQHVLEPLSGYLSLAALLYANATTDHRPLTSDLRPLSSGLDSAFNFGPALTSNRTVAALVQEVFKHWPGGWEDRSDPNALHEAKLLNLATDKVFHLLHWQPVWTFEQSIEQTVEWYRHCGTQLDATETCAFSKQQITEYTTAASEKGLRWVK